MMKHVCYDESESVFITTNLISLDVQPQSGLYPNLPKPQTGVPINVDFLMSAGLVDPLSFRGTGDCCLTYMGFFRMVALRIRGSRQLSRLWLERLQLSDTSPGLATSGSFERYDQGCKFL